jgi:hypothetical protein
MCFLGAPNGGGGQALYQHSKFTYMKISKKPKKIIFFGVFINRREIVGFKKNEIYMIWQREKNLDSWVTERTGV